VNGSIICIGNRFIGEDASGLLVYDRLQAVDPLPAGVEVIEGGLAGLNLLPLLERGGRVVFVDAVHGFTGPDQIVVLDGRQIRGAKSSSHYDHGAGLPYLLAVLPAVCEGQPPEEIVLVGLEGRSSPPTVERAARLSLALAAHGMKGLR
jgi:hydrogenase maturation protease